MDKQAYDQGATLALHDAGITKEAIFGKAPLSEGLMRLLSTPTAKGMGVGALAGGAAGGLGGGDAESILRNAILGAGVGGGIQLGRGRLARKMFEKNILGGAEPIAYPMVGGALGALGGGLTGAGLRNIVPSSE